MNTSDQGDSGAIGRLSCSIVINSIVAVFEIVSGFIVGSLALIVDALHNVTDVSSMVIGLWQKRKIVATKTDSNNHYQKMAAMATFIIGTIILGTVIFVVFTAISRFTQPVEIISWQMAIVAAIALLGNLVASYLFKKERHSIKTIWRRSWQDALISLLVIIGALAIYWTHYWWIDPALAIVISVFLFKVIYEVVMEALNLIYAADNREAIKK